MYNNSALWDFIWEMYSYVGDTSDIDFYSIGFASTSFLAYLVNFKAPGVST